MDPEKRLVIIAGPNGAGKTTFARNFLSSELAGLDFLNADEIAASVCPEAPESVAIKAGRIMLGNIERKVKTGESFAMETTLSGRAYARSIPRWRGFGYTVFLVFLWLPDAETAMKRVANRVREGGHSIPIDAIRRRYAAGWRNFCDIYKHLVDFWAVYDSFREPPVLLEKGINS